ncbi:MAG: diguanylate cyclase domain-containing protein [Oscillospiraceae bacterium]
MENTCFCNQELLDAIPGGVFRCKNDDRFTAIYVNDKFLEMTGYNRRELDELLGGSIAALIEPEDLKAIREGISGSQPTRHSEVEYRLMRKDGSFIWVLENNTYFPDNGGEYLCVLSNISTIQRSVESLKTKAENDSLTGLLNRMAFQDHCMRHFRTAGTEMSALVIMDIDNFRDINELYGHFTADTVLIDIAGILRRSFRATDAVGRVGGDEMMILIKDISDMDLIEMKLRGVLDSISKISSHLKINSSITCSMGIAVSPSHGREFGELYEKADSALYQAKTSGKNNVVIYNESMVRLSENPHGRRTAIDSDRAPESPLGSITDYSFNMLYGGEDFDKSLEQLLAVIGQKFDASRVYIFETLEDGEHVSNTYEWCAAGINSEKKNLSMLPLRHLKTYFDSANSANGLFFCNDIRSLPNDLYNIVAPQGIKCMVHKVFATHRGLSFIGIDDCVFQRVWVPSQLNLFNQFAQVIEVFLENHRLRGAP